MLKMTLQDKRQMKALLKKPKEKVGKHRYLVSVWLDNDSTWLADLHFKYVEDAKAHSARWRRMYGVTVTRISRVEI